MTCRRIASRSFAVRNATSLATTGTKNPATFATSASFTNRARLPKSTAPASSKGVCKTEIIPRGRFIGDFILPESTVASSQSALRSRSVFWLGNPTGMIGPFFIHAARDAARVLAVSVHHPESRSFAGGGTTEDNLFAVGRVTATEVPYGGITL